MDTTGHEVTNASGSIRGVVVDGHVLKSGPNKGKIEVMWIGGRWTTAERPEDLIVLPLTKTTSPE